LGAPRPPPNTTPTHPPPHLSKAGSSAQIFKQ